MKQFENEEKLAEIVVEWLQSQGWEVYQEVSTGYGDPVADIVAAKDGLTWIIECKLSVSLQLLAQVTRWVDQAHFVSMAVPRRGSMRGYWNVDHFINRTLKMFTVGRLDISPKTDYREAEVKESVKAKENEYSQKSKLILKYLHKSQKNWAKAGSSNGDHWTPFKETVKLLKEYITIHPGCTMKEAIDKINHHYSSPGNAVNGLNSWIKDGIIEGIERVKKDKKYVLYVNKEG